jgi:uncharacterized membrane protein/predicted DsbA family dithiol-disulfide isomerase
VPRFRWFVLLRIAALVALAGSSALTIDYLSPVPSFCSASSGCGKVQQSEWAYLGGLPLPAIGLAAFTALFTLSLLPDKRRRVAASVAIAGAVLALTLLLVQAFVVGAFCALCVTVDVAAIVAGIAGLGAILTPASPPNPEPLRDWAWAALAALAVTGPLLWPSARPAPDVPPALAAYYVRGKINVVEFVDFECPFCRLLHPELKKVVAEYGSRVNFVRLDLPLEMHPNARGAARAHVCASERGKGDPMADELFQTDNLEASGLLAAAKKVGLDPKEFERCLAAPETEAKVQKSERILRDAELLQGLPTTFVGSEMLVGAQDAIALRDAFEKAAGGAERGIPAGLYIALLLVGAGVVVFFGRTRHPATPAPAPSH